MAWPREEDEEHRPGIHITYTPTSKVSVALHSAFVVLVTGAIGLIAAALGLILVVFGVVGLLFGAKGSGDLFAMGVFPLLIGAGFLACVRMIVREVIHYLRD